MKLTETEIKKALGVIDFMLDVASEDLAETYLEDLGEGIYYAEGRGPAEGIYVTASVDDDGVRRALVIFEGKGKAEHVYKAYYAGLTSLAGLLARTTPRLIAVGMHLPAGASEWVDDNLMGESKGVSLIAECVRKSKLLKRVEEVKSKHDL